MCGRCSLLENVDFGAVAQGALAACYNRFAFLKAAQHFIIVVQMSAEFDYPHGHGLVFAEDEDSLDSRTLLLDDGGIGDENSADAAEDDLCAAVHAGAQLTGGVRDMDFGGHGVRRRVYGRMDEGHLAVEGLSGKIKDIRT